MKTVLEVLTATAGYFARHQIESPRLNAEHLLAHVLGRKRIELYLEFDRPLGEEQLAPLRGLMKRRSAGEPLQHLLGTVDFHGRIFTSDARALIPRPETERLVELVISEGGALIAEGRILDVGTGSGVIALTLAAELPGATVEAVDLSPGALDLARQNAAQLGLEARVTFAESDLLAQVTGPFDLIVANLPYIAPEALPTLAPEVQLEPRMALDGGVNGAEIIERLIVQAPAHLCPGGRLALEIGHEHCAQLEAMLARENYQDIRVVPDYLGLNRFLFATYG